MALFTLSFLYYSHFYNIFTYIFFLYERKNAYYINALCIDLQSKIVPGLSRWPKGTEGKGKYLASAPGNKVNL